MKTPGEQLDATIGAVAKLEAQVADLHAQTVAIGKTVVVNGDDLAKQMHALATKVARLEGRIPPPAPNPQPLPPPIDPPEPTPVGGFLAREPGSNAIECGEGDDLSLRLQQAQKDKHNVRDIVLTHDGLYDVGRIGEIYRSGMYIGAAPGENPILRLNGTGFSTRNHIEDLQLVGLTAVGEGEGTLLSITGSAKNILIEDCRTDALQIGLRVYPSGDNVVEGLTINRCILMNSYHSGGHEDAHGALLKAVRNGVFTENVVVGNGRRDSANPDRSHGVYFSPRPDDREDDRAYPWQISGNLFANNSSHGFKGGPGADVDDNLFIGNAIAFYVSRNSSSARRNAILDSADLNPDRPRGYGFQAFQMDRFDAIDNIVANTRTARPEASGAFAIEDNGVPGERRGNRVFAQPQGRGIADGVEYIDDRLDHAVDLDSLIEAETNRPRGEWSPIIASAMKQIREAAA